MGAILIFKARAIITAHLISRKSIHSTRVRFLAASGPTNFILLAAGAFERTRGEARFGAGITAKDCAAVRTASSVTAGAFWEAAAELAEVG